MSQGAFITIAILVVIIAILYYRSGIRTSGKRGGLLYGEPHEKGGIKTVVKNTGEPIEVEGDEVIINKSSIALRDVYMCTGTPLQISSKINEINGYGVMFADGGHCLKIRKSK